MAIVYWWVKLTQHCHRPGLCGGQGQFVFGLWLQIKIKNPIVAYCQSPQETLRVVVNWHLHMHRLQMLLSLFALTHSPTLHTLKEKHISCCKNERSVCFFVYLCGYTQLVNRLQFITSWRSLSMGSEGRWSVPHNGSLTGGRWPVSAISTSP